MAIEKKFNKLLIWLVIGTTIAGVAGSQTPKGKKVVKKVASGFLNWVNKIVGFFQDWIQEMKKNIDWLPDNSSWSSDMWGDKQ